jgi:hypothetical protein
MRGAQTKEADLYVCLDGIAGTTYSSGLDVNKAVSCATSPQILDLPVDMTNDTTLGYVKYCCKNGTILPAIIDPSKSKAAFTMMVYKVPPGNTKLSHIVPPGNFKFGDGYYQCGPPRLIEPSVIPPDPATLQHEVTAYKTWQVIAPHIYRRGYECFGVGVYAILMCFLMQSLSCGVYTTEVVVVNHSSHPQPRFTHSTLVLCGSFAVVVNGGICLLYRNLLFL